MPTVSPAGIRGAFPRVSQLSTSSRETRRHLYAQQAHDTAQSGPRTPKEENCMTTNTNTRAALYMRVSGDTQDSSNQVPDLERFCAAHGWEIVGRYAEVVSGKKDTRPELKRLMDDALHRRFDVVLVWALDRFGRSVPQVTTNIRQLDCLGVRFISVRQNIDTDQKNPASRLLINMLASIAEFEHAIIQERVAAGSARYREECADGRQVSRSGKNLAIGRPRRIFNRERAHDLRTGGMSYRRIADELGVSVATVFEALRTS